MFGKSRKFFGEVKTELQKATWPWDPKERGFKKYKQLIDSTIVVLIATLLLGGFIAVVDFLMVNAMRAMTTLSL
ncbi:MAG: preprotein translocase subunit SecE [Verrucomicrobia bacterium]|nr:preprotein translocase subunit SecE [Verrucomicrobiota bacterium]